MSTRLIDKGLPIGFVLTDNFRVEGLLGQGGFGTTYLATDIQLDCPVAIKEYNPSFAIRRSDFTISPATESNRDNYSWGFERFLKEAQLLAKFHHPNIVRVRHVFRAHETAYIVMDYEHGVSLLEQLDTHGLFTSDQQVLDVLLPIVDGLSGVHEHDFLHRDIKPHNLFVRNDGTPLLLDFGSARIQGVEATRTVHPGYTPIEQFEEGHEEGAFTDIYSLGAAMYHAIKGRPPPSALTRQTQIIMDDRDPYIPLRANDVTGDQAVQLVDAINASLIQDPRQRPQTLAQWQLPVRVSPFTARHSYAVKQPDTQATVEEATTVTRKPIWFALSAGMTACCLAAYLVMLSIGEREFDENTLTADTKPLNKEPDYRDTLNAASVLASVESGSATDVPTASVVAAEDDLEQPSINNDLLDGAIKPVNVDNHHTDWQTVADNTQELHQATTGADLPNAFAASGEGRAGESPPDTRLDKALDSPGLAIVEPKMVEPKMVEPEMVEPDQDSRSGALKAANYTLHSAIILPVDHRQVVNHKSVAVKIPPHEVDEDMIVDTTESLIRETLPQSIDDLDQTTQPTRSESMNKGQLPERMAAPVADLYLQSLPVSKTPALDQSAAIAEVDENATLIRTVLEVPKHTDVNEFNEVEAFKTKLVEDRLAHNGRGRDIQLGEGLTKLEHLSDKVDASWLDDQYSALLAEMIKAPGYTIATNPAGTGTVMDVVRSAALSGLGIDFITNASHAIGRTYERLVRSNNQARTRLRNLRNWADVNHSLRGLLTSDLIPDNNPLSSDQQTISNYYYQFAQEKTDHNLAYLEEWRAFLNTLNATEHTWLQSAWRQLTLVESFTTACTGSVNYMFNYKKVAGFGEKLATYRFPSQHTENLTRLVSELREFCAVECVDIWGKSKRIRKDMVEQLTRRGVKPRHVREMSEGVSLPYAAVQVYAIDSDCDV